MAQFNLFTQHPTQDNGNVLASIETTAFFRMVLTAACSLLHEYADEDGFGIVPTKAIVKSEEAAVSYILKIAGGEERNISAENNTRHMRLEIIEAYVKYKYTSGTAFNFLESRRLPILVYYVLLKHHNRTVQKILAEHKAMRNKQWGSAMRDQKESLFTMVEHWPRIYEFNGGVANPLPKDIPGYLEAPFPED